MTNSGKDYFFEKLKERPVPLDMANPFFIKSFFFRFLREEDVVAEFEKEIQSIEETLGDLKNLKDTVESQADEHGQFIYRTTILLFETMQNAIAAVKLASYAPDVVIEIPRDSCGAHEFHRAREIIELGHRMAAESIQAQTSG